jgi:hypothetical protein
VQLRGARQRGLFSCEARGNAACAAAMGAATWCVQLRGVLRRSPRGCERGSQVARVAARHAAMCAAAW